jgi:sortase A
VARLQAPGLGIARIVLAGTSGRTLAFGPGHMDGTAAPGTPGHAILSGHRDTHFRFLKDLKQGDALRVQRPDGGWQDYRVIGAEVIDARQARLAPDDGRPVLSLVTCYPFDAIAPGGPLRYVVTAAGELLDEGGTTEARRHREPTTIGSPRRHEGTKNTKKVFSAPSAQPN